MKQAVGLIFLLIVVAFTGCQQEDTSSYSAKPVRIVSEVLTRSAMESGFVMNDNIGVFMLKRSQPATPAILSPTGDNWINNVAFYLGTDERTWESTYPIYWDDPSSVVDVIAYYPYRDISPDTDDMTRLTVQVAEDQSSLEALRSSDFLYATCTNITPAKRDDEIALGFKHKLCKLTVNLDITANGHPLNSAPSVVANNIYTNATINLTNGAVACGDTQADVIFHYDAENQTAEAILPPQTIKSGTLISVIFKDLSFKAYTYDIKEDLVMKEGKEYIINFSNSVTTKIIFPIDYIIANATGSIEKTYLGQQEISSSRNFAYQTNVDITIEAPSWMEIEDTGEYLRINKITNNYTLQPRKGEILIKGGGVTKKINVLQETLTTRKYEEKLYASEINNSVRVVSTNSSDMQHYDASDIPDWLAVMIRSIYSGTYFYATALQPNKSIEPRSYSVTIYRGEFPEFETTITQLGAELTISLPSRINSTAKTYNIRATHDFDLTLTYPACSWIQFPVESGGVLPQTYRLDYDNNMKWERIMDIPITVTANTTGAERSTTLTISNGIESKTVNIVQLAR